jgi:hypothetical protein
MPSTQKPDWHSLPAVHAEPVVSLGKQVLCEVQKAVEMQSLSFAHDCKHAPCAQR